MSVKARCLNYTGCLLAYRGEIIELAEGAPLTCPECGKTVSQVAGGGSPLGKILAAFAGVLVLGAILFFAWPFLNPASHRTAPPVEATTGSPAPGTAEASDTHSEVASVPAEPPTKIETQETLDLNVARAETAKVQEEVLKRIDMMPNVTSINKDRLYVSVQRARSMGLLITIPFQSGAARITATEIAALKGELEKAQIAKLREDPTAVFVVLGYADPKGDEKKNLAISQYRADSVVEAMRDKCGISNLAHAVAMGGSRLLDASHLEKNRVVEVWAVLP